MSSFSIVKARPEHVDAMVSIQTESGLSEWAAEDYTAELNRPEAVTLVAEEETDYVAGFITGRMIGPHEASDREAEIYNIGVRTRYRRAGIGSTLLKNFLAEVAKHSVYKVWLDVRASNQTAIDFYSKHGFEKAGRRPRFYSSPVEDAQIMLLRLGHGEG